MMVVIYDLQSLPEGQTIDDVINKFQKDQVLVWSSNRDSRKPEVIISNL